MTPIDHADIVSAGPREGGLDVIRGILEHSHSLKVELEGACLFTARATTRHGKRLSSKGVDLTRVLWRLYLDASEPQGS